MSNDPFNDLIPIMQERLNKWRTNASPVKSANIPNLKSPGNFVSRKRDYGDDMNEFTKPKAKDE